MRGSEGVVSRFQFSGILSLGEEKGEIHHPEEVKGCGITECQPSCLQEVGTQQPQGSQCTALQQRRERWDRVASPAGKSL